MKRALHLLASLALVASVQAQTRLDMLRADTGSQKFAQVQEPWSFEFPRDHGPHPAFRQEWWYVTGHLEAAGGKHFGFELTFFRYALAPRAEPASQPTRRPGAGETSSAWRTSQIYMAHFAVTDLDRREFHFAERHSRDALGLAGAQGEPLRVWLEEWFLKQSDAGWSLHAASGSYRLDLELQPQSPVVLNGEAGLSRKSAQRGAASYYYSMPRITVSGRMVRDGAALQVQGSAWLDREWGSGSLAAEQSGWDWFALQLNDGSSLMFYVLRRRDGSRDPFSAGTWVGVDGQSRGLKSGDVEIDVLRHWASPRGGDYPAAWRVRVPSLKLDLQVRPKLADQELSTSPRYWEGAVSIEGRQGNGSASGQGYVELVGYAAPR